MSTIALLGTGLLGAGFVENLLAHGHTVRVWNRTAAKATALETKGASAFSDAAEAVRGAERVHLVLRSDDAVDAVIAQLLPGLGEGVPVLDHSTNLPVGVASRFGRLRARGVRYLPAPVFMSPHNARTGTGIMLASGAVSEFEALRSDLEQMTGDLRVMSDRPDQAAILKLTGNGLLFVLAAGMGDLFQLAVHNGLEPEDVLGLFDTFTPSPNYLGKRALKSGNGEASFELTMAHKDVELMVAAAGGGEGLRLLPAIAAAMQRSIDAGHGSEDFAIFAKPKHGVNE